MSLAVLPLMTLSLFAGPVINSGAYGETSEKSSLTDATQKQHHMSNGKIMFGPGKHQ